MTTEEKQLTAMALREFATGCYRRSVIGHSPEQYHLGCKADALAEQVEQHEDFGLEPHGSHDMSDDGDALASAGHGTDEDYGGSHGGVL